MKIGTLQNVLNEPLGSSFHRAGQLGFAGIELDWSNPSEALPGGSMSPSMRAMMVLTARNNNLEIASVAAHFLNNGNIASADSAVVSSAMLNIRRGIELCHDIGAKVLLVPFFYHGEIEGDAGIDRLTRNLGALAAEAASAGVTLGIENTLSAVQNAAVIDAVGSPAVGVYWDMANGVACGYDAGRFDPLGRMLLDGVAFRWMTDGRIPRARRAMTPPTPRRSSWRIRTRASPP